MFIVEREKREHGSSGITFTWGEGQTPPQLIASIALILNSYSLVIRQEPTVPESFPAGFCLRQEINWTVCVNFSNPGWRQNAMNHD